MPTRIRFANKAKTTLASPGLTAYNDANWPLTDGSKFSSPGASELAFVSIQDTASGNEAVYSFTARGTPNANTLNGLTWLSGVQQAYAAGCIVEMREPAEMLEEFMQRARAESISGPKTFDDAALIGNSLHLIRQSTAPAIPATGRSSQFIHQFASNPNVGLPAWVSDIFSSSPGYLAFSRRSHRVSLWWPGNTALATQSLQITNTGGAAGAAPTYGTNYKDEHSYTNFSTTAVTGSSAGGVAGANPTANPNYCVGRSTALERGLWDAVFYIRFDASSTYASQRSFFGFNSKANDNSWINGTGATAMLGASWDGVGIGYETATTNLSIITNDGGANGTVTAMTIARAKATGIQDKLYVVKMAHAPGDGAGNVGGWYMRIEEYDAGFTPAVLFEGLVNTAHMPRANIPLYPYAMIANANQATASSVKVGVFESSAR